jgi:hypothetical protein
MMPHPDLQRFLQPRAHLELELHCNRPHLPTRLLGSNAAGCPNASDGFEELEEDNETYCVINSANQILFEAKKVMICPPDAAGETFLLMQRCDNGRTLKAKCDFVVSQAEAHRRAM